MVVNEQPFQQFVLTDDELCAISFVSREPLPTLLQTVDVRDADSFRDGVARGMASLMDRGIAVGGGQPGALGLVGDLFRFQRIAAVCPLDDEGLPSLPDVTLLKHSDTDCTVWKRIPAGLHEFRASLSQEAFEALGALIADRGPQPLRVVLGGADNANQVDLLPDGQISIRGSAGKTEPRAEWGPGEWTDLITSGHD